MENEEYQEDLLARLSKIQGQIKGVAKMVADERECEEILLQISAAGSSLDSVARLVVTHHVEHCVVDGIKHGDEKRTVDDLVRAFNQFAKLK